MMNPDPPPPVQVNSDERRLIVLYRGSPPLAHRPCTPAGQGAQPVHGRKRQWASTGCLRRPLTRLMAAGPGKQAVGVVLAHGTTVARASGVRHCAGRRRGSGHRGALLRYSQTTRRCCKFPDRRVQTRTFGVEDSAPGVYCAATPDFHCERPSGSAVP